MGTKVAGAGMAACRRALRDLFFRWEGIAGAGAGSVSVAGVVGRATARGGRGYSSEAAAVEVAPKPGLLGDGGGTLELVGATKDYYDYRRSLYGDVTHKALLVDAVGTLLVPSQPTAQIYRKIGEKYGVEYSEEEILNRYRWAYEQPWGRSRLRYVDDGRPFWQFIVSSSTGCSNSQYFEELYQYYMTDKAWYLCDPDAERVFKALRKAGVKIAVVSNFDTRLRPLLQALKCDHWFDAVAVSAKVAAEKPNPTMFLKACDLLGVMPEDAVHVGDDRRNDIWGPEMQAVMHGCGELMFTLSRRLLKGLGSTSDGVFFIRLQSVDYRCTGSNGGCLINK